jgi:ribonuclease D
MNDLPDGSTPPVAPQDAGHARRARYSRSRHRSHSHASAHAEDQGPPLPEETGRQRHPLVPGGEAWLVTTQDELEELIAHLRAAGIFAYDTEFIGELTYVPKLCLVQVASAERVALIDPLSPATDLMPFWKLLSDQHIEKIVHAGQQDIEPVFRNIHEPAGNVFDTQIAAGFIGMAYPVALGRLVKEVLGVKLGKGLTFTHWDQRPLSKMQLRYAADDVRYLPALRQEIGQRLKHTGHEGWARQEFESLCEPSQYSFNPDRYYLRVRGAQSLPAHALANQRELTIWRDSVARAHDVPARALLKDDILIDLSRNPVKSVEKLDRVRGLPRPVEHAHGAEIVEATLRGLATPADHLPQRRDFEPSPTERFGADALWAVAQCLCIGQRVDPSLVTSRQEIGDFYHRYIAGRGEVDGSAVMDGWRRQAVAEPMMKMIDAQGRIAITWTNGCLCASSD